MSSVTKVYKNTPQEHAERVTKKWAKSGSYISLAFLRVAYAPFF